MKIHKIYDLDYEWVEKFSGSEKSWTMYHTDRMQITKTKHGEFRVCDRAETIAIRETLKSAQDCGVAYYQINC